MRHLLILPALLLTLACSSKLDRSRAEDLIRKDYPVVVPVTVPDQVAAEKGTPEHTRFLALKEHLEKTGWFDVVTKMEGVKESFTFRLKPDAPKAIKAAPKGFSMPAAEAGFVRVLPNPQTTREGVRVTYEIRLEKPTAQFALFQSLFPDAKLGQTKIRYATFERRKGAWEITGTNEVFHKAE
jgi:hypothetical protein